MSEFTQIVQATLTDWGVEVNADSLARLDGLDSDGLYSLILAASQVLTQIEDSGVEYEDTDPTVLTYEERWEPPRAYSWRANADHGILVFRNGSWYIERDGASIPYSFSHFGYLNTNYFPMERV